MNHLLKYFLIISLFYLYPSFAGRPKLECFSIFKSQTNISKRQSLIPRNIESVSGNVINLSSFHSEDNIINIINQAATDRDKLKALQFYASEATYPKQPLIAQHLIELNNAGDAVIQALRNSIRNTIAGDSWKNLTQTMLPILNASNSKIPLKLLKSLDLKGVDNYSANQILKLATKSKHKEVQEWAKKQQAQLQTENAPSIPAQNGHLTEKKISAIEKALAQTTSDKDRFNLLKTYTNHTDRKVQELVIHNLARLNMDEATLALISMADKSQWLSYETAYHLENMNPAKSRKVIEHLISKPNIFDHDKDATLSYIAEHLGRLGGPNEIKHLDALIDKWGDLYEYTKSDIIKGISLLKDDQAIINRFSKILNENSNISEKYLQEITSRIPEGFLGDLFFEKLLSQYSTPSVRDSFAMRAVRYNHSSQLKTLSHDADPVIRKIIEEKIPNRYESTALLNYDLSDRAYAKALAQRVLDDGIGYHVVKLIGSDPEFDLELVKTIFKAHKQPYTTQFGNMWNSSITDYFLKKDSLYSNKNIMKFILNYADSLPVAEFDSSNRIYSLLGALYKHNSISAKDKEKIGNIIKKSIIDALPTFTYKNIYTLIKFVDYNEFPEPTLSDLFSMIANLENTDIPLTIIEDKVDIDYYMPLRLFLEKALKSKHLEVQKAALKEFSQRSDIPFDVRLSALLKASAQIHLVWDVLNILERMKPIKDTHEFKGALDLVSYKPSSQELEAFKIIKEKHNYGYRFHQIIKNLEKNDIIYAKLNEDVIGFKRLNELIRYHGYTY